MKSRQTGRFQGSEMLAYPLLVLGLSAFIGTCLNDCEKELQHNPVRVTITKEGTRIDASRIISGYFPVRAFDYNNDGTLDNFERLLSGAPRIPFGAWHEMDKESSLAKKVQEAYEQWRTSETK